jgi:hypothetical protein
MGGINFNTGGGSSFDPANPGPIGGTTPSTGAFTRLTVAQGTLTDPVAGINLTATWNDAADTFHVDDADVTDTASSAASTLLRRRVGGVTMFELRKNGFLSVGGTVATGAGIGPRGNGLQLLSAGVAVAEIFSTGIGLNMSGTLAWTGSSGVAAARDTFFGRGGSAGVFQLGENHATTAIAQRIQAHGVTTGTGASLTLGGGSGTVAKGDVILDGGNRSVYSPADFVVAPDLVRTLVSHGLMQLAGPLGFATSFGTPSESTLDVIWDDEETGIASQYRVEISSDDISFTLLEVVDQGVNLISASGLTPDTTYYFRIRSESAVGNSEWVFTNGATSAEE